MLKEIVDTAGELSTKVLLLYLLKINRLKD